MGAGESREEGRGAWQWLSVVVVCKKRCVPYVINDYPMCVQMHLTCGAPPAKSVCVAVFLRANINTGYCTQWLIILLSNRF